MSEAEGRRRELRLAGFLRFRALSYLLCALSTSNCFDISLLLLASSGSTLMAICFFLAPLLRLPAVSALSCGAEPVVWLVSGLLYSVKLGSASADRFCLGLSFGLTRGSAASFDFLVPSVPNSFAGEICVLLLPSLAAETYFFLFLSISGLAKLALFAKP